MLGIDVGTSEDGAFWLAFLRSLAARGLGGVELVTSDAHQGLKDAIARVFAGASWQRCRTHFMINLLSKVPRRTQPWVATMVRTIYQQPSPEEVYAQHSRMLGMLDERFPQAAELLADVGPDILAFTAFPVAPLEAGLVEQPSGAPQQGDTATHRCRGHLPQPPCGPSAHRGGPRRAARRVAGRPPLSARSCRRRRRSAPHGGIHDSARRGSLINQRG